MIRHLRKGIKRTGRYFTYILECRDGTYYTGYTNNLEKRLKEHNNSCARGARYLRGKTPVKLVWDKQFRYYKRALQAERRIKTFSRKEKDELVRIYAKSQARQ